MKFDVYTYIHTLTGFIFSLLEKRHTVEPSIRIAPTSSRSIAVRKTLTIYIGLAHLLPHARAYTPPPFLSHRNPHYVTPLPRTCLPEKLHKPGQEASLDNLLGGGRL